MEQDTEGFISRYVSVKKYIRLTEKGYPDRVVIVRRRAGAIERHELTVKILASCGRLITGEPAGVCSVCHLFECCQQHLFLCTDCRRSLCAVHVHLLQVGTDVTALCASCYEQDTWRVPLLSMRVAHEPR